MKKSLVALALAAALAGGPPSLLDRAWTYLTSVWSAEGFGMDPSGLPAPRADEGCGMDPNGRCLAAPPADEGFGMDPNG